VALTCIEICAGAGGQALGLEAAGFNPLALVEVNRHACATLRTNRPYWNTVEQDVTSWHATAYRDNVDLFAAGVPCPPFSKAGKQLGGGDKRDLFPTALRLIRECQPRAVMLENVRGLLDDVFLEYREGLEEQLIDEGYRPFWKLLHASDFGVPQLRPRTVLVALKERYAPHFSWPTNSRKPPPTVGASLVHVMASGGWEGADTWSEGASSIAPTLVGGSEKHGGPDLGPTRAREAWAALGVNGKLIADDPPSPGFVGAPSLTVEMAAIIQGFPRDWRLMGKKTNAYRQVGNAFPPAVARAVARRIALALKAGARPASFATARAA
jgi:DNA (cytosine-5)-methyltransferase 1